MDNRPRVVIADDESSSRVMIKALLKSLNCEVVGEAVNGAQAVEMYKTLKPHLLVLDINMPLMTGDEVLQEIMKEHPQAFVIVISALADMARVEKCLFLGAANYIRKDTSVAEMRAIIRETWQEFMLEAD